VLPEWKRRRATGGGALLDLGAHHLDLLRFLLGREIAGVRASIASRTTEQDTALLELEFDDGVLGHCFFGLGSAETDHIEVHGEAARLSVARFSSLDVDIVDNPGSGGGALARALRRAGALRHGVRALRARHAPLREPGYAILLDRFVGAARAALPGRDDGDGRTGGGRPGVALPTDTPDIADGFACTAIIAAAEQSLRTGRMEAPAAGAHGQAVPR
jgi:predicted dehydrogenase